MDRSEATGVVGGTPATGHDALVELAGVVLGRDDLATVLDRVVHVAVRAVPAAAASSVTLIENEAAATAASTGPLARDPDDMQYERGHGPCLDAGRAGVTLHVPDMRREQRWPDYAAAAVRRGVLSSVSVPLPVQGRCIGALNVYASRPHAFDDTSVAMAETVAGYAAVAVHNVRAHTDAGTLAAQMREAMSSRAVIEQAKGVVMADRRCSPDEAFTLLTRVSQHANRKLRDVAAELVRNAQQGRPGPES